MGKAKSAAAPKNPLAILRVFGCGSVPFSGGNDGLYERRLVFDHAIEPAATSREQFEALAAERDVFTQHRVETAARYDKANPKQVYDLSMEFLIRRSLANTVTSLMLSPVASWFGKAKGVRSLQLLEEEPAAGLGRLAAYSVETLATLGVPARRTDATRV